MKSILLSAMATLSAVAYAVSESQITYTVAHAGQDFTDYKKMYKRRFRILLENRLTQDQLAERFDSMVALIEGDSNFEFLLFEHEGRPAGFIPFFRATINGVSSAVVYDASLRPECKSAILRLFPTLVSHFNIQKGYWLVGDDFEGIKEMATLMKFAEDKTIHLAMDDRIKWNSHSYTTYSRDFVYP